MPNRAEKLQLFQNWQIYFYQFLTQCEHSLKVFHKIENYDCEYFLSGKKKKELKKEINLEPALWFKDTPALLSTRNEDPIW